MMDRHDVKDGQEEDEREEGPGSAWTAFISAIVKGYFYICIYIKWSYEKALKGFLNTPTRPLGAIRN